MRTKVAWLLVGLLLLGGLLWLGTQGMPGQKQSEEGPARRIEQPWNILLVGTDEREGVAGKRTDALVLVMINPERQEINLVSIPRDTWIKDETGGQRVNAIMDRHGVVVLQRQLGALLRLEFDRYVQADFKGFQLLVDALGGVTVDVDKDMKYRTSDTNIDLRKGRQRLNGDQALQFARYRQDPLGDITRIGRQQQMLAAIWQEVRQPQNLVRLLPVIPRLLKLVETDLQTKEIVKLASVLGQQPYSLQTQTLPGKFGTIKGASVWLVDQAAATATMQRIQNIDEQQAPIGNRPPDRVGNK